jgi:hypothetical protein
MDDLEPLRQANPRILVSGAHLYKPRDAYRSGGYPGVEVKYWLARAGEPVTLEFLDRAGRTIASATSVVPAPVAGAEAGRGAGGGGRGAGGGGRGGGGGGGGGARPSTNAGFNTYIWNLRYPGATTFQGMILWSGNTGGPLAAPGTYTVRMTGGSRPPQTQTFVVKKDPRSKATDADLVAQHDFLVQIRDQVSRANNAVRTIRNVKWHLADRQSKLTGRAATDFAALARSLSDSLSAAEGEIYQVRNQSGQDPLNYPIKLNNQIAALTGFVAAGDRAPPKQARDVYGVLIPQLDREIARLDRAIGSQLPRVNAALRAAGQPEIVPSTDELGPPPR